MGFVTVERRHRREKRETSLLCDGLGFAFSSLFVVCGWSE